EPPRSLADWSETLRKRFAEKNRQLGVQSERLLEFFNVTAWGRIPSCESVLNDLPNILPQASNVERLRARLARFT
ncbi:MAG: hypothetical protein JWR69_3927, partial [Pedosphaera sp.]|nr:hypothetical protein [Pedosphaera sp.]